MKTLKQLWIEANEQKAIQNGELDPEGTLEFDSDAFDPTKIAVKNWLEQKRQEYIQKNHCFSERVISELLKELESCKT